MIDDLYNYSRKQIAYSLYGTMLGDSSLQRKSENSYWFRTVHSNAQREYIESLEYLYKRWGFEVRAVYDYESKTALGDSINSEVRIKLTPPVVRQMRRFFPNREIKLSGNKKIVTAYVMRRITPLGLLLWWLDDGSLCTRRKGKTHWEVSGVFCTHGFTEHENFIIQKYLDSQYQISTTINKRSRDKRFSDEGGYQYYQRLNKYAIMRLIDVMYPVLHFIPESMIYKIDLGFRNCISNDKVFECKYDFLNKEDLLEKQKKYCNSVADKAKHETPEMVMI